MAASLLSPADDVVAAASAVGFVMGRFRGSCLWALPAWPTIAGPTFWGNFYRNDGMDLIKTFPVAAAWKPEWPGQCYYRVLAK